MTANSNEELDDIPEHDKREADKETKGAAKVRDKGVKGVDEVLPQNDGAQRPVPKELKSLRSVATTLYSS